ncbi:hypothetical protein [Pseudomonas sp. LAIL14HWK12:I7]|uniref:hypothetical protein n=1 Tax=Pseudomonas sp. LAIL14HWK12:I7 TaxID=1259801 RepID=UPI0012DEADCB|nr:hypothetical protein [Pseudomonas sp. LAIL14HWK12:I7]
MKDNNKEPTFEKIEFDDRVMIPGPEENLINTAKMEDFLNITIPKTSEWPVPSYFYIMHSSESGVPIFDDEYKEKLPDQLHFQLPSARFKKSKKQSLEYSLKTKDGSEKIVTTSFTVDLKKPIQAPPLEMDTTEFNLAYFDNYDGLDFTAPPFTYNRVGDYCIVTITGPEKISATLTTPPRAKEGEPIIGKIPKNTFFIDEKPIYGEYTLMYTALSRAGNESRDTEAVTVTFSAS